MSYTITKGPGLDDYIITLADGRVLVIDGRTLSDLHTRDGTLDNAIDIDGLIANATAGGGSHAVFTSSSGTGFTVTAGNGDNDFIIALADGRTVVLDGRALTDMHNIDKTLDNQIDIEGLIANAAAGGGSHAVVTSSSGTGFTVTSGNDVNDYIITLADGRTLVLHGRTMNVLHSSDGTFDNQIDIDGLIANAAAGNGLVANLLFFALGTWITTPNGQIPIEELAAGDMVVTMDHGPQPIRWIG